MSARHADRRDDRGADGGVQRRAVRRDRAARLGDDDQPLGARPRILDAERGDAAAPDPRHVGDRFLDFLRVDVAAAGDDHVLGAAGDEEIAVVVDEAEIAGVDPAAVAHHRRRRLGVLEVALHRRRAAELDAAFDAGRPPLAGIVDDAQLVPRDRLAAGDERQRLRIVGRGGLDRPRVLERLPAEALDAGQASRRRGGHAQAALGQAVDRPHRLGPEAERREARREALDRAGEDGFGAVQRDAPRRQIEPFEIGVRDLARAQVEGEVGRRGDGAAMPRDRLEPAHRLGQEGQRRHRDDRHAVVERPEPRADQAHVVVQRQPRDADVVAGHLEGLAEGADVGEQVGVRQRHALRRARAPRRVLDQRQRIRVGDDSGVQVDSGVELSTPESCRRSGTVVDRGQGRRERAQERGGALGLGERQQDAGARVAQDRGLARGVLLDLIGAERRVERHRDAAGEQDAHVGVEERRLGAEQQRDALARRHAAVAQAGGHAARVAIQAAVGDQRLAAVVVPQLDVDAIGAALDLPAQRLDQRPRGRWPGPGRARRGQRPGRGREQAGRRPGRGRETAGRRPGGGRVEARPGPGRWPPRSGAACRLRRAPSRPARRRRPSRGASPARLARGCPAPARASAIDRRRSRRGRAPDRPRRAGRAACRGRAGRAPPSRSVLTRPRPASPATSPRRAGARWSERPSRRGPSSVRRGRRR